MIAPTCTLTRFCYAPEATFGQLRIDEHTFYSVERPWRDNQPYISCIPEGEYQCRWEPTSTSVPDTFKGHTWYVEGGTVGYDVGERTRIALHVGNTAEDVHGCMAFGKELGVVYVKNLRSRLWAVQKSVDALRMMRALLPDQFNLTIKWGMAL